MRAPTVLLALCCLTVLLPVASAGDLPDDVTIDEPVDLPGSGGCRGTNGAYGFWGDAWFGSGGTGAGRCHLHVHVVL